MAAMHWPNAVPHPHRPGRAPGIALGAALAATAGLAIALVLVFANGDSGGSGPLVRDTLSVAPIPAAPAFAPSAPAPVIAYIFSSAADATAAGQDISDAEQIALSFGRVIRSETYVVASAAAADILITQLYADANIAGLSLQVVDRRGG